jgi:predicted Zn-dependent protease
VSTAETAVGGRRTQVPGAFVLADVYQEAKRHADAIGVLTPLSTARPDDDAVAFRLGAAYETAGRVPDAEKAFRAIIARDPLNANALNYLGYMLATRGLKLPEALTLVDRALVVEPGNPAYLDSRGWALFKMGRAADAEAPLRQAATAFGGSSVIQVHFAEVLAALGKRDEAASRFEQALKGDGVDIDRAAIERRLGQVRRGR